MDRAACIPPMPLARGRAGARSARIADAKPLPHKDLRCDCAPICARVHAHATRARDQLQTGRKPWACVRLGRRPPPLFCLPLVLIPACILPVCIRLIVVE